MVLTKVIDSNRKIRFIIGTIICILLANFQFAQPAQAQMIDSGLAETYPNELLLYMPQPPRSTTLLLGRSNFKFTSETKQSSAVDLTDEAVEQQQTEIAHTVSTSELGDNQSLNELQRLESGELFSASMNGIETGGLIYNDLNRNGVKDSNESGIRNVDIEIYADTDGDNWPDGAVLATANSGLSGNYRFTGLADGDYVMNISASFFNSAQPLHQLVACAPSPTSSTPIDPDNDVDGDNNAVEYTTATGVRTMRTLGVTLTTGGEPTSEDGDANTNLTIDLCFYNDSVSTPTLPSGEVDIEPEAFDDEYVREINTSLTESIIANDTAGNGPLLVRFVGGEIAPGLTLNAGGDLDGTVTQAGEFVFEYEISDYDGDSSTAFVTVTVESELLPLAVDDIEMLNIGDFASVDICANDFFGSGFGSVAYTSGDIAPGLTLTDCILSGVTNTPGTFVFDYLLTDTDGDTSPATVTIIVDVFPVANDDSATGNTNTPLILDICDNDTFGDGFASVTFLSGTIPPGMELLDCILDGAPNTPGTFVFDYELADIDGDVDTATVTIIVNLLPDAVDDSTKAPANIPFSMDICVNDDFGDGFSSTTLVSGVMPPGLSLDECIVLGIPTTLGEYIFEYELEDIDGDTDRAIVTIIIDQAGTITVVKKTTSGDSTFTFGSNDEELDLLRITTSNGTGSSPEFVRVADTYTIRENPLSGWVLDSISISGDVDGGSSSSGSTATIDLDPSENIVVTFVGTPLLSTCSDGTNNLGGIVWRDFNGNGVQDADDTSFYDAGITVHAYNDNGQITSTTLNPDGTYSFSNIFATTSAVRLEFSGLPSWVQSSAHGNNSGTTIQVHKEASCVADLAIQNPADYCENNSLLVTSCYVNGDQTADMEALVGLSYDRSGTVQKIANDSDIGSTWGIAYKSETQSIFAASILKRHAGTGAGGLDAIYVLDYSTPGTNGQGAVVHTIELNDSFGIDVGADPRANGSDLAGETTPSYDAGVFSQVGKVGLGDIDISEDEQVLYVMNLNGPELVALDVSAPTAPGLLAQYPIANPGCSGTFRPWAIEVADGQVYIGGVCDDASTAYVLQLNTSTNSFVPFYDFALGYDRGCIWSGPDICHGTADWLPWEDSWDNLNGIRRFSRFKIYPQPILSDIEFDSDGSLILGFMDRIGHQLGSDNYSTDSTTPDTRLYAAMSAGDIIRACWNGSGYDIEGTGSCPYNHTGSALYDITGEYYNDELFLRGGGHGETPLGGLAYNIAIDETVGTVYSPIRFTSGGLTWFNNDSGAQSADYELYAGGLDNSTFGKAAGLGDVELLCTAAPLEIGNYVWLDADGDGIQDPSEAGIDDVAVGLYDSAGTLLATTTTNEQGEYYFNDTNVSDGLLLYTQYEIKIDLAQIMLEGHIPTQKDASGGTANPDAIDSDGASAAGGFTVATFTTAGAGQNDHTIDFGFTSTDSALACATGSNDLGGQVWQDFNGDGIRDASDVNFFSADISVYVYDDDNNEIASTALNTDGSYSFKDIFATTSAVRVEFGGLPSWVQSSVHGSESGTTVQVHKAASCTADLAVQNPAEYCNDYPYMVTSCFVAGEASTADDMGAIVRWQPDASSTSGDNEYVAYVDEVGSVAGLAFQEEANLIYAGAYAKRHSDWGLGADNVADSGDEAGAIYVMTNKQIASTETNIVTIFTIPDAGNTPRAVNGPTMLGSGNSCNSATTGTAWEYDSCFFGSVGKEGLGDLELSADGNMLWTVNLNNRHLYMIDVTPNGANYGSIHDKGLIANPGCAGGSLNWRPFALEFHDGQLYVGGVCTGETNNWNPTVDKSTRPYTYSDNIAQVSTHVVRLDDAFSTAANSTSATRIFEQTDMSFNRGLSRRSSKLDGRWFAWLSDWNTDIMLPHSRFVGYPQPMLADIEFDDDGSMILGYRDRTADQVGDVTYAPRLGTANDATDDTTLFRVDSAGDLIRVCWNGSDWEWEGTGSCPAHGNSPGEPDTGDQATAEFYQEDYLGTVHQEIAQGGLALAPRFEHVASTAMDPVRYTSGGVRWFNNIDGTASQNYEVFSGRGRPADNGLFGKANGLGDLEYMCSVAPIEIGNYVWFDADGDGIQDPGESGIAGVDVGLYDSTDTQIATTTTDGSGKYYFNDANVSGGLTGYTQYQIKIDLSQASAAGNISTRKDSDSGTVNPDAVDSDGITVGGFAVADIMTLGAGQNDHKVDFGLTVPPAINCSPNSQEAEDALLSGAFVEVADSGGASGGAYIWAPEGTGNIWNGTNDAHMALFCIEVPEHGRYRIVGTAKAETDTDDSFFVTVDGSPEQGYLWDVQNSDQYVADYVSHRSVSDPVEVILSAGQHMVGVYLREDGTKLDKMALELVETVTSTPTCGAMEQEAEDGALYGNFVSHLDSFASGSLSVGVKNNIGNNLDGTSTADRAEYCLTVPQSDTYHLVGTVLSPNGRANSFYVTVDGQPTQGYLWDTDRSSTINYIENDLSHRGGADPVLLNLTAGDHKIVVYLREDGTKLDTLKLVPATAVNAASVQAPQETELIESENIVYGTLRVPMSHEPEPSLAGHTAVLSGNQSYETTTNHVGRYYFDDVEQGTYNIAIIVPTESGDVTFERTLTVDESGSGLAFESVDVYFEYESPASTNTFSIYLPTIR